MCPRKKHWHPRDQDTAIIGGDTHAAGAAIAVPLRILVQQPIQNTAPTPTMFIIVIDPFCCNQTLRLVQSHQLVAKLHQNAPNRVLNFKKFPGVTPSDSIQWGLCLQTPGEREGTERGRMEGGG